jgi:hypothetical protein
MKKRVPLRIVSDDYIEAPNFCPFSDTCVRSSGKYLAVNPLVCGVCNTCEFIPDIFFTDEISKEETLSFQYFFSTQQKIASAISGQIQFLNKKDRIPLQIIISSVLLKKLVDTCIKDEKRGEKVFRLIIDKEQPICYIAGCPVYVSRKMTKSDVQVVGEVEWN